MPAFCKYICPAGTFEGAIGLLSNPANRDKFSMLGILFTRKFVIMLIIALACVFIYRAFCRFLCPLGAIYGLFAKIAVVGVKVEAPKCTSCGRCTAQCPMDIRRVGDHECIHCGRCIDVCPTGAISLKAGRITLRGPQTDAPSEQQRRGRRIRLVAWAVALAVLVGALWYFNRPEPATPAPETPVTTAPVEDDTPVGYEVGMRAPDFSVPVVGLSGGLDSTLALLVMARAADRLGWDRKRLIAVTMPCYGTTSRTRSNAENMALALGVTFREIPIGQSVAQHFSDIGLPPDDRSVTYENGQARERTQVLMDLANRLGGLVIGTGDLSELALGWATYNGDHMSMYAVNAGVPKTLVRHIVDYVASQSDAALSNVLRDILATPVSPELLPPTDGEISQKTEDLVGPYELHDFFLYQVVRCGYAPGKVYRLARLAFRGRYPNEEILRWLQSFYRRFFQQQFKRSCLPDGPKVGSVTLSPRGDWRMPSDAAVGLWLKELENLEPSNC